MQAPARLEVVRRSPLVILDTFHNPHGAASAMAGVRESFEVEPLIAVVAAMADKDVDGVLAVLSDAVSYLVVTSMPDLPRALSVDELADKRQPIGILIISPALLTSPKRSRKLSASRIPVVLGLGFLLPDRWFWRVGLEPSFARMAPCWMLHRPPSLRPRIYLRIRSKPWRGISSSHCLTMI